MNDRHGDELERRIEEAARTLPRLEPSESLWRRIENRLQEENPVRSDAGQTALPLRSRWREFFSGSPRLAYAAYTVVILLGIAAGAYFVTHREGARTAQESTQRTSEELYEEARSDIQQAMHFYERAIVKLSVLAERNEGNLDPRFVELQKEKIGLLRASISECKSALEDNQVHPQVQHYLLTAYTELQTALQEMANAKN